MSSPKRKKRSQKRKAAGPASSSKAGQSPGTLAFIGEQKVDRVRIDVIDFDEDEINEHQDISLARCVELARAPKVTWINVNGVHDLGAIETLGREFGWHALTQEDIADTAQRPKAEQFPEYVFMVLKMMEYSEPADGVGIEHVSLILGDNYVVSLLEDEGDVFDAVRHRIRTAKGRIRSMKADYLAYALMDAVVDHYFLVVERIGDRIEELDDKILTDPQSDDIQEIHRLKRGIMSLRKAAWPLREEIAVIEKSASPLIGAETRVFLRDLYDHTIQVIDMVESFREILGSVHDTYLSSVSNRMNEVMKMLTIVATIFIPLTFIAGVYGMNFENMPELKWPWGYYLIMGIMAALGVGMLMFFKRRKWL